jgi:hypothetical protein
MGKFTYILANVAILAGWVLLLVATSELLSLSSLAQRINN